jgi:hypothetical protein
VKHIGCGITKLIRDAFRKLFSKPPGISPVAISAAKPKRISMEHDSVHDEP